MKYLINAACGGLENGIYHQTAPAKNKFEVYKNFTAFEGAITRKIAGLLLSELIQGEFDCEMISSQLEDDPIVKRIQLINDITSKEKDSFLISIHCDTKESDGFEVYGDPALNDLFGYQLAERVHEFGSYREAAPQEDIDFINQINCRAIVINVLSYKKEKQAEFLMQQINVERIAFTIYQVIKQIEAKLL